jgi:hypothetical protein
MRLGVLWRVSAVAMFSWPSKNINFTDQIELECESFLEANLALFDNGLHKWALTLMDSSMSLGEITLFRLATN